MSQSILVVDDEQAMRAIMHRMLRGMGYTTVEAESGEMALAIVSQTPVDLVITDLKMSGMDGLSLAQKLLEQDPDRPVLLMTAYADMSSARRAVGVGIYEYFTKPFDVNDVVAGVRRALENRRLVLENRAYQKDLEQKVEARTREMHRRVQELEARDELLRHLLSIQEQVETLSLAVRLALHLCNCDAGALYLPGAEGDTTVGAAVGFLEPGAPVLEEELPRLGLVNAAETEQALQKPLQEREFVCVHNAGAARQKFGIHSFGILPVCKGKEVTALLEVGRRQKDVLVGEMDLEALQGFLPYVAMAVVDCKLQEKLARGQRDVEEILKTAEEWTV